MFQRAIYPTLMSRLKQFPIAVLTGPRQSGKTTLLKTKCAGYDYINLESPDAMALMTQDPKAILNQRYKEGLIIDEAQKFPDLFSYIQVISDEASKKGQFILSGSQNFLLNEKITQSLAGRAAILELLPLTYQEYLSNAEFSTLHVWEWLYQGGYPRPYQDSIPINVWADSYIQTYVERDVRTLLGVKDLMKFHLFLRLCAGRHGQILNYTEIGNDCGVSSETVHHWIGILEASYIVFRLPPFYKNYSKRLVKSPKLYFYDSGLVCYLLGIDSPKHLSIHASRGAIFEGYVISTIRKYFLNQGVKKQLYFWRDSNGVELDCLFELEGFLHAIEIKSTSTFQKHLLKSFKSWEKVIDMPYQKYLIYTGESKQVLDDIQIVSWNELSAFLDS